MKAQNVHYFPGHMQKALRIIENYAKVVDLIVEIVDARAPFSSRNPLLDKIANGKSRIILLSKSDMADQEVTSSWISYFKKNNIPSISGNLKKDKFVNILSMSASSLLKTKREKEKRFGMKPQPIKAMIIGIPNVGKSTLINNLGGRKIANVGNKAGITRAEQWIKLSTDFILLDTPGVLPMNYLDKNEAVRLALLGSMREDVLPTVDLSYSLLDYLRINYPDLLNERFSIDDLSKFNNDDILLSIASRRGLLEGKDYSIEKAAYLLIKEFKDGLLGRASLERPSNAN